MRVAIQGESIPYPIAVLRGKLRLSGVPYLETEEIISEVLATSSKRPPTEQTVTKLARDRLKSHHSAALPRFDILIEYDLSRSADRALPPVVLVLEGASATGKSMLSLPMILNLAATRVIGTDTIRQVLRAVYSERDHPELYCHTYQAYEYRQVGPKELSPIVRGYLAQCELIEPVVRDLVERIAQEGADAVIEGVHIRPGTLKGLSAGVTEAVVEPGEDSHRAMFMTKHAAAKLRTVSGDHATREREFQATRLIQEYLVDMARRAGVHILQLSDYDQAEKDICNLVVESAKRIIEMGGK